MKYKAILISICLVLTSCTLNTVSSKKTIPYSSKGFAYIYQENDFKNKILKIKLDNSKLQISHNKLSSNVMMKIINPKTNDSILIKNYKKTDFPDYYKVLITKKVAEKLNIDPKLPLVEVIEVKRNKSFVAKKAKIYNEEKKISSNAPVTSVQISNISKNNNNKKKISDVRIYIMIGTFYSEETAVFLRKRIIKQLPKYNNKKLRIIKKSNKKIDLISGPYSSIDLMKNDYVKLKKFGFEELDITINE